MIDGVCPVDFRVQIEQLFSRWETGSGFPAAMRAMKELRRSCAHAIKHRTHPNAQRRLDVINAVYQSRYQRPLV